MFRREFLAIAAVGLAGCAGWGTDGPAGSNESNETNETEANESTNESNATEEQNQTDENDEPEPSEDDGDPEPDDGPTENDPGEPEPPDEPEADEPEPEPENESENESEPSEEPEPEEPEGPMEHTFRLTVEVVDQDGQPVEGEPVGFSHADPGDEPAYHQTTDENGETSIVAETSDRSDVLRAVVTVRDEQRSTFVEADEHQRMQFVVSEQSGTGGTNENDTGALRIAAVM